MGNKASNKTTDTKEPSDEGRSGKRSSVDVLRYLRGKSPLEILVAFLVSGVGSPFIGFVPGGLIGATLTAGIFKYDDGSSGFLYGGLLVTFFVWVWFFLVYHKPTKPKLPPELEYIHRRQEELFNRLSAAQNGKEGAAELAQATLIIRAKSTKQDLERLWDRSRWAFSMGCVFLGASLLGPVSAIWLVAQHQDWRYFLASASSSAVMLAAAAAIFSHENKLRAQYQMSSDEIAYFDRLQVALDCARAVSEDLYKDTLRQIISFLVAPGPALSAKRNNNLLSLDKEESADTPFSVANKVIDASTELAKATLTKARK